MPPSEPDSISPKPVTSYAKNSPGRNSPSNTFSALQNGSTAWLHGLHAGSLWRGAFWLCRWLRTGNSTLCGNTSILWRHHYHIIKSWESCAPKKYRWLFFSKTSVSVWIRKFRPNSTGKSDLTIYEEEDITFDYRPLSPSLVKPILGHA